LSNELLSVTPYYLGSWSFLAHIFCKTRLEGNFLDHSAAAWHSYIHYSWHSYIFIITHNGMVIFTGMLRRRSSKDLQQQKRQFNYLYR